MSLEPSCKDEIAALELAKQSQIGSEQLSSNELDEAILKAKCEKEIKELISECRWCLSCAAGGTFFSLITPEGVWNIGLLVSGIFLLIGIGLIYTIYKLKDFDHFKANLKCRRNN